MSDDFFGDDDGTEKYEVLALFAEQALDYLEEAEQSVWGLRDCTGAIIIEQKITVIIAEIEDLLRRIDAGEEPPAS